MKTYFIDYFFKKSSDSDCYELVYNKRNQNYTTTDLTQEKTTTSVKSEHEKENR